MTVEEAYKILSTRRPQTSAYVDFQSTAEFDDTCLDGYFSIEDLEVIIELAKQLRVTGQPQTHKCRGCLGEGGWDKEFSAGQYTWVKCRNCNGSGVNKDVK